MDLISDSALLGSAHNPIILRNYSARSYTHGKIWTLYVKRYR